MATKAQVAQLLAQIADLQKQVSGGAASKAAPAEPLFKGFVKYVDNKPVACAAGEATHATLEVKGAYGRTQTRQQSLKLARAAMDAVAKASKG